MLDGPPDGVRPALRTDLAAPMAKGALAGTDGISVDEAFTLMRGRARRTQRRVVDAATEILGEG